MRCHYSVCLKCCYMYYPAPAREWNIVMLMSVLSVRTHISGTLWPNSAKFSVAVAQLSSDGMSVHLYF